MAAKTLNEYRAERYLTVDEFAELLGVTPQTLYRIARGETHARPTTIRKIAKSLGVHPTEIAEFTLNTKHGPEQERPSR
jgi:transcriptional regulator with XRE-family HTH domain